MVGLNGKKNIKKKIGFHGIELNLNGNYINGIQMEFKWKFMVYSRNIAEMYTPRTIAGDLRKSSNYCWVNSSKKLWLFYKPNIKHPINGPNYVEIPY